MKTFGVLLVAFIFCSVFTGCASRGFYLSQQMPGVDNKLNVLPENSYYAVRADGEVVMENSSEVAKRIKGESHNSNAADSSRGLAIYVPASHRGIHVNGDFINSTLDPANGALLVNVGEK